MTKIKKLKLNSVCENFTFREVAVLAQHVTVEAVKNGKKIFAQGEEGDKLFLLASGKVAVKSDLLGHDDFILTFEPNDFFGELSLFGAGPRKITAMAISDDTILFSISRKNFETLCESEPFVAYKLIMNIMSRFSSKLKDSANELTDLLSSQKQ